MPSLTASQLQTLKTAILGNSTWNAYPNTADGNFELAKALNAAAVPDLIVWRTDAQVNDIYDAIDWTKFTPQGALDDATLTDATMASRRQAQLLAIQTKQMNLQNMLQGRSSVNAAKVNVRAGLRDATIQLPAGTNGAGVAAGGTNGTNVLNACTRKATEIEKILVTASQGSDTTGSVTARVMGYEGTVTPQDVETARNLP